MYNIEGINLNQFNTNPVIISVIKFEMLKHFIKFTQRLEENEEDPFNTNGVIKDDFINKTSLEKLEINTLKNEEIDEFEFSSKSYYQRLFTSVRLNSIYNFLIKEINNKFIFGKEPEQGSRFKTNPNALGIFPTAIILSMNLCSEKDETKFIEFNKNKEKLDGVFVKNLDEKLTKILIPENERALIVDGQHRIAALIKLYKDAKEHKIKILNKKLETVYPELTYEYIINSIENFQFNCTILLGFDKWEQGKVFADVNFNQKPVNKSLYYDIFGSFPDNEKNDIYLAHMLTMHLNNNEESPIYGFIKMLGKGQGYFSQAFLVEAILKLFSKNSIWANIPIDFMENGKEYLKLPKFFKAYFSSIKEEFSEFWPRDNEKYESILCKTTGMGALLTLINDVYKQNFLSKNDIQNLTVDEIKTIISNDFKKLSDSERNYFFSKDGNFSGSGSLGSQSKLYRELKQNIYPKKENL